MALTAAQKAMVARLTRETYPTINALPRLSALTPAEEELLIDDADKYEAIQDSHVKLQGGANGLDFDNARKRAAIFYRVRIMLGLPFLAYDLEADVLELLELEVGSKFA